MTEYDNSNRGVLFVNERKEKDTHSDYNGNATIVSPDGETFEVWLNGWKKKGENGKTFLSLSFKAKQPAEGQSPEKSIPAKKAAKPKVSEELDDDIPF